MSGLAGARPVRIRKFYSIVGVGEAEGGFSILLDGKHAKTRAGRPLRLPARPLAEAVAAEWAGEGETADLSAMRLTRLAATAIDLAETDRARWEGEIASYAQADLLCYRAEAPRELSLRQAAEWTPYLDWARTSLRAPFVATEGVVAVVQPDEAIAAVARAAAGLSSWRLVGTWQGAMLTGSAVLALALERRAFAPAELFSASLLDARFQSERWGVDAEAAAREALIEAEFDAAARWLALAP